MKQQLRKSFREIRRLLSSERRAEAEQGLLKELPALCNSFNRVASFCSMRDEINLSALNERLAQEERLLLPRRNGDQLQFYLVTDLQSQLESAVLPEPVPHRCRLVELSSDDLLLIPALAFDPEYYRLGCGKGFYDRFLAQFTATHAWGLGFREQMSRELLPRDPWDRPIQKLWLL